MNWFIGLQELLLEVKNGVVVDQGEELNTKIESQLSQIMQLESDPSFTLVGYKTFVICVLYELEVCADQSLSMIYFTVHFGQAVLFKLNNNVNWLKWKS